MTAVIRATLNLYGYYDREVVHSTTIAGGLVYGLILNNVRWDEATKYEVMFTNFVSSNSFITNSSRVSLYRVVNLSEPFTTKRLMKRGNNYTEFRGYLIVRRAGSSTEGDVDKSEVEKFLRKYIYYAGNNFTTMEVGDFEPVNPPGQASDLCLHNLVFHDFKDVRNFSKAYDTTYKLMKVETQPFRYANYLGFRENDPFPYALSVDEHTNQILIKKGERGRKEFYVATFRCVEGGGCAPGSFYRDELLEQVPSRYERLYLKAGTGVIGPCVPTS